MKKTLTEKKIECFHCGEFCPDNTHHVDDKYFCCSGCLFVYKLLSDNDLEYYYDINYSPGKRFTSSLKKEFKFLDLPEIREKLIDYSDDNISTITLFIPQIHCSSCIWLLENLHRVNIAVIDSKVNFLRKEVSIKFNHNKLSLRLLVELLASLGYKPDITLVSLDKKPITNTSPDYTIKLAVAGFCFANIMLFSFPEYLATDGLVSPDFRKFFGYLNIGLSLPVFFYSASGYLSSAFQSLKQKMINIDVPISLGIFILFSRSLFDIISQNGSGYLDSMSGLVFFLLIGKYFQQKTYDSLSFDRDYKSYFPISVTKITENGEEYLPVTNIREGDRILIRNLELVPADALLIKGEANIDNSFITGEHDPVQINEGDKIFAGGRQIGTAIELKVLKDVSQSYLTRLWNDFTFHNPSIFQTVINKVSKYFTLSILGIALLTALYWLLANPSMAMNAVTSVLIIACPCALALSIPFSFGTAQRVLGRNKLYLKDSLLIETISKITNIIFDKTGTLTKNNLSGLNYSGQDLCHTDKTLLKSLTRHSTHPLSVKLFNMIDSDELWDVEGFEEILGQGIIGIIKGYTVRIGSSRWVNHNQIDSEYPDKKISSVYIKIDEKILGSFNFENQYRDNLSEMTTELSDEYSLTVLSGDNDKEKANLNKIFDNGAELLFNQSPISKLNFVKRYQTENKKILMLGDGLNDAGALKQSDIGIAVTEDVNSFTPASDAIFDADNFDLIPKFLSFSKKTVMIVLISFGISFLYNIVGLSVACQGMLSPLIAAIFMPLSSITVVLFTTISVNRVARKIGL
ncbi:heavy metal translocating P-type ATPase [Candidatus Zixiibacteriota bacterium]